MYRKAKGKESGKDLADIVSEVVSLSSGTMLDAIDPGPAGRTMAEDPLIPAPPVVNISAIAPANDSLLTHHAPLIGLAASPSAQATSTSSMPRQF
jgi:hypothetical protein